MSRHATSQARRRVEAAVGLLVCVALATIMTGCETVAGAGTTGISVGAQGQPVVVFAVCNDHIHGATIYRDRTKADPKAEDPSVSVAEWVAASPITPTTATQASLDTAAPSGLWSTVGHSEDLRPGVVYVAYGWTRDNTWFTGHVEFTLERLAKIQPGQVLTQTYIQTEDEFRDIVQPYAEFEAAACTGRP